MSFSLFYAFTVGAVATVNPCGWALLPAWFARRMDDAGDGAPLIAAMRAGALATLGFIIIFGLAGAAIALGAAWVGPALPYIGFLVGVVLAGVGGFKLLGNGAVVGPLGQTCTRISERHGSLVFGLGYGLLSLTCTLPIFLAVVGVALTNTPVDQAINLLVYALGMGTVLSTLGIVAAISGNSLGQLTSRGRFYMDKFAAILLLTAAAYIIFYWGRIIFGDVMLENPIINTGDYISSTLGGWLTGIAGRKSLVVALVLLVLALLGTWVRSKKRPR